MALRDAIHKLHVYIKSCEKLRTNMDAYIHSCMHIYSVCVFWIQTHISYLHSHVSQRFETCVQIKHINSMRTNKAYKRTLHTHVRHRFCRGRLNHECAAASCQAQLLYIDIIIYQANNISIFLGNQFFQNLKAFIKETSARGARKNEIK